MTEHGWEPAEWQRGEERRDRLPRLEDLPSVEGGYDRKAVERAFNEFYRHAAQLDTTLRMLESFEAFQRQAADLRSDLRSLRAASGGEAPAPRTAWTTDYRRAFPAARTGPELPEALPRVAVEAAFIILVAVGAALAGLSTALVVVLVLAAWLVVGLVEVVASAARPGLRRSRGVEVYAPSPIVPVLPPEPLEEPVVRPAGEATMLDLEAAAAPPPELETNEPEEAAAPEPVVEADADVADEADDQPEPATPKRRWWRRRAAAEPEAEPEPPSGHERVPTDAEPEEEAAPESEAVPVEPGAVELVEEPAAKVDDATPVEAEAEAELPTEPADESPEPAESLEPEPEPELEPAAVAAAAADAVSEPEADAEDTGELELPPEALVDELDASDEEDEVVTDEPSDAVEEPEPAPLADPWLEDDWPDLEPEDPEPLPAPPARRWWRRRSESPAAEHAVESSAAVRRVQLEQVVEPAQVVVAWEAIEPEPESERNAEPHAIAADEPTSDPGAAPERAAVAADGRHHARPRARLRRGRR
jgi:hypothetical protein